MSDLSDSRMPRDDGAEDQNSLGHLFKGWFRSVLGGRDEMSLRATIEELLAEQGGEEGSMGAGECALLSNILKLGDSTVSDVMVPRADIRAINVETPFRDVVRRMAQEAHSRLPVYRETLDDVLGMVHIKDVLGAIAAGGDPKLEDLVREVSIVAPSMAVVDLLMQMRQKHQHLALVVDEFGGIDGLVTFEDLVEEIVGEIEDEHDEANEARILERPDGTLIADARLSVEDFEKRVGEILTEEEREDIDTLGGLVVLLAGRVPGRGETLRHSSGTEFDILDADHRRIKRLRVRNLPTENAVVRAAG